MRNFLYYILKEDGRSAEVVNDVVTYSGQPKPLPEGPDGWQELALIFERSLDKHGLLTKASLPFGFVRKAARIVRDALYRETVETKIFLLIQRRTLILTLTTYNWFYKYFFKGEFNLPDTVDAADMVSVPILESSLTRLLNANGKTVFEFPMNDPVCVNLKADGIAFAITGKYLNPAVPDVGASGPHGSANYVLPISTISSEGVLSGVAFVSSSYEDITGDPALYFPGSTNYFFYTAIARTIRIRGSIKADFGPDPQGANMKIQDNYNTVHFESNPGGTLYTGEVELPFDVTVPLLVDTKLFFWVADPLGNTIDYLDSDIFIEFENTHPASNIPCYKRFDLFRKLCGKVFNDENAAISELLQIEENNNLLITCGDAIRGLPNATLKTSLEDFFKDCDSIFMCGQDVVPLGFEIEEREKYYTESDEIDLGNVVDFEKSPAKDRMFNTFKFGHQKQTIEDVNGKYDPNGNNQFTGPLTVIEGEYNMVSPYKAGPYEIEIMRINFDGKTTTDDSSDNDVFVIKAVPQADLVASVTFSAAFSGIIISNAERFVPGQKIRITGSVSNDGVYDIFSVNFLLVFNVVVFSQAVIDEGPVSVTIEWLVGGVLLLDRPAYDTLEGVPNNTIFNLPWLTPKAMLLRHKRWIASMNAGLDDKKITFANGKENKNTGLKTVLAGVTIDEDAEEAISDMGPYMWLHWYFTFKTEVPIDLPQLLEENPNRSFKITDEYGNVWRGFLVTAGIAPNEYTAQEFKLLATPNNDILKLIHG